MPRYAVALTAALLLLAGCDKDRSGGGLDDDDEVVDGSGADADASDDVEADDVEADEDVGDTGAELPPCEPVPTAEALLRAGEEDDGVLLAPGGRGLDTPGTTIELAGFPSNTAMSPDGEFAYVLTTGNDDRGVYVIDVDTANVVQEVEVDEAFYGIAIAPDGGTLYVSGGVGRSVFGFDVDADAGTLTLSSETPVPTFVSGLDVAPDGATLFVGGVTNTAVFEVDTSALGSEEAVRTSHTVGAPVWDVVYGAGDDIIVASTLHGVSIEVIDRGDATLRGPFDLGQSPMELALAPDEATVFVAVSGIDELLRVDVQTGEVVDRAQVTEGDHLDGDGESLPRSNASGVTLSPDGEHLYVTRGADNAVSVFAVDGLAFEGSFPTTWFPTSTAITPDGNTLVVSEGRGFGSGPSTGGSPRNALDGNASVVDLSSLDLGATTAAVVANFNRPRDVFPFECDGFFPIPVRDDVPSPIEHVILVVKENKTFDCVFGDLEGMDVDVDPERVRWGEEITPNQHALAREFTISDNFYTEVENSDMGHITLTSGFLTDFVERVWLEASRSDYLQGYQVLQQTIPRPGNLFTHLLDHDIDIRVYGEIVGMFARDSEGREPMQFSDREYPGGPFYNMNARDADRARYVLDRIAEGDFATFTFMLLPNDHTGGTAPGNPTPEAEVADNDEAVGILVEGLSRSEHWENTAIIVVEDDPQGCTDHVDTHRSFVMVMSPWARRGHVSHVNYSFQSIFATILRILGVPPMGRPDAGASPMWDMFTATPDLTPFEALPRLVPEEKILDPRTPGAEASMRMDFRGPDRNEDLGVVLDAYRLWRMGRISREEADARIEAGIRMLPDGADREEAAEDAEERAEEAEEERYAFDQAWTQYEDWLRDRGEAVPELTGGPIPEESIRAFMDGRLAPEQVTRARR